MFILDIFTSSLDTNSNFNFRGIESALTRVFSSPRKVLSSPLDDFFTAPAITLPGFYGESRFPAETNPWERVFPRPAPPSNEEMIKGLDRVDRLINFVIDSTEINGVNPRMLDRAHNVLKARIRNLTRGLDSETAQRIQQELDEAFASAKEGDLSKLERFQEKLKTIREDYNNQDNPRAYFTIPCTGRLDRLCEVSVGPFPISYLNSPRPDFYGWPPQPGK